MTLPFFIYYSIKKGFLGIEIRRVWVRFRRSRPSTTTFTNNFKAHQFINCTVLSNINKIQSGKKMANSIATFGKIHLFFVPAMAPRMPLLAKKLAVLAIVYGDKIGIMKEDRHNTISSQTTVLLNFSKNRAKHNTLVTLFHQTTIALLLCPF
jgi:hypothetical protein